MPVTGLSLYLRDLATDLDNGVLSLRELYEKLDDIRISHTERVKLPEYAHLREENRVLREQIFELKKQTQEFMNTVRVTLDEVKRIV